MLLRASRRSPAVRCGTSAARAQPRRVLGAIGTARSSLREWIGVHPHSERAPSTIARVGVWAWVGDIRTLKAGLGEASSCVCLADPLHRVDVECAADVIAEERVNGIKRSVRLAVCACGWLFGIGLAVSLPAGVAIAAGSGAGRLGPPVERSVIVAHRSTPALPMFIYGSDHAIRPRNIYFSGDGGNIVGNLRWSSWTASRATGAGQATCKAASQIAPRVRR